MTEFTLLVTHGSDENYPVGSKYKIENGVLVATNPDGRRRTYSKAAWRCVEEQATPPGSNPAEPMTNPGFRVVDESADYRGDLAAVIQPVLDSADAQSPGTIADAVLAYLASNGWTPPPPKHLPVGPETCHICGHWLEKPYVPKPGAPPPPPGWTP